MITKADFSQIRKIVREEIEVESRASKDDLRAEIKLTRIEIQKEIRALSDRLKNLEIRISKLEKDIKKAVDFLDREHLGLVERVEQVEHHLSLPISS